MADIIKSHKQNKLSISIRQRMDKAPLWLELTTILTILMILLTAALTTATYRRNRQVTLSSETETSRQMLQLKTMNLERYIDELAAFSIQSVYDNSLYASMQSRTPLSDTERSSISSYIRGFYYSRSDLNSFMMYLINQGLDVGYSSGSTVGYERVRFKAVDSADYTSIIESCNESPNNCSILPASSSNSLFHFDHTIVRVRDKSPIALISFDVDLTELEGLTQNSTGLDRFIVLLNSEGDLLYSDLDYITDNYGLDSERVVLFPESGSSDTITLNGVKYLSVSEADSKYGLKLVSLVPVGQLTQKVRSASFDAVLEQIMFFALAIVLIFLLVRWLTQPLSVLSSKQEKAGTGDFSSIDIGRSREIKALSNSFNEMTTHIGSLIDQNYASELNEKTAQLAALEAQMNPHFLYNTLQAIGSEALMHDEMDVYTMLTSLAGNLRYSIKAAAEVPLQDEMKYVDNYIRLQKVRMGDRLTVSQKIDPATLVALIPKISIQPLVENSIQHGIQGDRTSVKILIEAFYKGDYLVIRVTDDGIGISPEDIGNLNNSFTRQTLADNGASIGLTNLYHRIRLMYENDAALQIKSETGESSYTSVTMILSVNSSRITEITKKQTSDTETEQTKQNV